MVRGLCWGVLIASLMGILFWVAAGAGACKRYRFAGFAGMNDDESHPFIPWCLDVRPSVISNAEPTKYDGPNGVSCYSS